MIERHDFDDPEEYDLFKSQVLRIGELGTLVDASHPYEETLAFLVHRILSNRHCQMYLVTLSQLSELGTGWNSSFENGNAQSDIRDDVVMTFITAPGGSMMSVRLRKNQLTVNYGYASTFKIEAEFPQIDHAYPHRGRPYLADIVDAIMATFWFGGEFEMPVKESQ